MKADKAEADRAKAASIDQARAALHARTASIIQAKAANSDQAKAVNKGTEPDSSALIVSREQRNEGLRMWKELLMQTNDYQPFKRRTEEENLKEVKVLRSAMAHFRSLKLSGYEVLRATHPDFRFLQERNYIPADFCMPADLFREEQLDYSVIYKMRCCSVYDFYNMLSKDNPCYVDRQMRRENKESVAGPSATIKPIRHENPATKDGTRKTVNPAYNPFVHASSSSQPHRRDIMGHRSTNPSDLNWEQMESAEKAEVRRRAPIKNAPIPSDGDETNTDGETSMLYEDQLLPAQKSQILKLNTEIKRIKSKNYTPGYMRDKERAINHAELERIAGRMGPDYLAGVKFPWTPDRGQAPIHYDDYQVYVLNSKIEKIKNENANMCQLEYTANKGGPGGQARR